jgi:Xaa-Pro aminopeptidase
MTSDRSDRAPDNEYHERWAQASSRCKELGLDGLVVWSRGGGTVDSFADVLYLANHYSPFPLINDLRPYWSGRSHSVVVLPVGSEPTLVVEMPDWRRDLVAVADVRFSLDLPAATAKVMRERGLSEARLGLVGAGAMVAASYIALMQAAHHADFVQLDTLIAELRSRKSPFELDRLREAGEVGDKAVAAMIETALKPGRTEAEAVAAGCAVAISSGVAVYDACVASGPNSDHYAFGRLPSWTTRTLEVGDFFHVDTYGAVNGYLYDFARCCVVGGKASRDQREVLEAAIDAVNAGIAAIGPGARAGAVYEAVHSVLAQRSMLPKPVAEQGQDGEVLNALSTSFPAHGHSFGMGWEPPWLVEGADQTIEESMCFGIEAMAGMPRVGSAKFEQDVLVTRDGVELLTRIPTHYWS